MCSLCLTSHTGGVTLMVAPKTGKAGQQGNSVGKYICGDLACSLYVRGKKMAGLGGRPPERLTVGEKVRANHGQPRRIHRQGHRLSTVEQAGAPRVGPPHDDLHDLRIRRAPARPAPHRRDGNVGGW